MPSSQSAPDPGKTQRLSENWHNREILRSFEGEISRQEDLLYGVALFFEGIRFLYAGQDAVIETYQRELRNIIGIGHHRNEEARRLLEEAKRDSSKARLIEAFTFTSCQGYDRPEELAERAKLLVEAHRTCFPGRPRKEPLSDADIVRLLNSASEKIELASDAHSSPG
ncbi:hypothetical protein ACFLSJ_07630 [Verrucomicrobiota bacterium]